MIRSGDNPSVFASLFPYPSPQLTLDAFLVDRRPALLASYGAGLAAAAPAGDGHAVLVSARQQRVPIGDERQPHVLAPLHHLLRQELLQVRVSTERPEGQNSHTQSSLPECKYTTVTHSS